MEDENAYGVEYQKEGIDLRKAEEDSAFDLTGMLVRWGLVKSRGQATFIMIMLLICICAAVVAIVLPLAAPKPPPPPLPPNLSPSAHV